MSAVEKECRWSIVQAYALWHLRHGGHRLNLLAYERALGLEFF